MQSNDNKLYISPVEYKKREDEASGKMGELLLRGWSMQGNSCEDCMVPFMKSKQGDEICVVCDRNFRKDSKKPIPQLIIADFVPQLPVIEEVKEEPVKVETKVQVVKETVQPQVPLPQKAYAPIRSQEIDQRQQDSATYGSITLTNKVNDLLEQLVKEKDLSQIQRIIETIDKIKSVQEKHFS
ncbi:hypothetical protein FGO68_gene8158 [Halteria grandinella]|uniref:Uncharacterized protein n=1 Tax=Halteria grandinella TaxID=5974 RepID=A0A8J8T787_HALGN|nr:hypothetical protein FGO68_gene8158 [Halteria grandinella]